MYVMEDLLMQRYINIHVHVCIISVKYEKIKFLVIALHDSIEIYAWAPKPYHKFMAFKVSVSSKTKLGL